MPGCSNRLCLDTIPLTAEWQLVLVPIQCASIELVGDKSWEWCTDKEGAVRRVGAGVKEMVIDTRTEIIQAGSSVCCVRLAQGETSGTLWRKFY